MPCPTYAAICSVEAVGGTNEKALFDGSPRLASRSTTLGSERPEISSGSSGASVSVACATASAQSAYLRPQQHAAVSSR